INITSTCNKGDQPPNKNVMIAPTTATIDLISVSNFYHLIKNKPTRLLILATFLLTLQFLSVFCTRRFLRARLMFLHLLLLVLVSIRQYKDCTYGSARLRNHRRKIACPVSWQWFYFRLKRPTQCHSLLQKTL